MKSKIIASLICLLFVTALALAQEPAAPAAAPAAAEVKAPVMLPLELRKTGVVNVTKDAGGKVTAIKLIVTSYDIALDEKAKELEAMDGQKVRITCTLSHEGGKRVLTVKSIEVVTEGGAPAAPAAVEKPAEPAPAAE